MVSIRVRGRRHYLLGGVRFLVAVIAGKFGTFAIDSVGGATGGVDECLCTCAIMSW
jgi:hypothetical protein